MTEPYEYPPMPPGYGPGFGYAPVPPPPPRRTGRTVLTVTLAVAAGVALGAAAGNYVPTLFNANQSTLPPVQQYVPRQDGQGTVNPTPADTTGLAAKIDPSLVDINTTLGFQQARAAGTGIVLNSSGTVLTNNHVIDGATSITATDIGNGRAYQATVVGYDRGHDVAVVQLKDASGLAAAPIGSANNLAVGSTAVAIGNAGGVGGAPSVAPGTITALNQSITATSDSDSSSEQLTGLIQTDANVAAGDSGGPLVNTSGQVIGMDTAASSGFQMQAGDGSGGSGHQGFAIPIDQAMGIAKQIQAHQASTTVHIGDTALLGVQAQPASTGRGRRAQYVTGAVVAGVISGSPAEGAGLVRGDVVTSINGKTVDSPNTLTDILSGFHPGDSVRLGWLDAAGQHTAIVQLTTGPAQ
jgi:S1-C subfamily serine protease